MPALNGWCPSVTYGDEDHKVGEEADGRGVLEAQRVVGPLVEVKPPAQFHTYARAHTRVRHHSLRDCHKLFRCRHVLNAGLIGLALEEAVERYRVGEPRQAAEQAEQVEQADERVLRSNAPAVSAPNARKELMVEEMRTTMRKSGWRERPA